MDITIRGATTGEIYQAFAVVRMFASTCSDQGSGIRNCAVYEYGGADWAVYWTAKRNIVVRKVSK